MGTPVTIVSSAPGAHATGQGTQQHLIYAQNSGRWWLFYFSGTNVLATKYSSDFVTWTTGATLTLAHAHNSEGRGLSVVYDNISSTDVVHIGTSYNTSVSCYHTRATISGTTITFGAETLMGTAIGGTSTGWDGPALAFDSNNKPYHGAGFNTQINTDFGISSWSGADTGSSWTPGTETDKDINSVTAAVQSHWCVSVGSGNILAISDNANATNAPTNLLWSTGSGATWGAAASVLASSATGKSNGWGATAVSTTDIHVVYQSSTATFTHRRWNGISWSNGNTIGSLTFKSEAGVALVSDGTSVWLFAIASASGNAISYNKWTSGSGWGGWTTFESSSATRNNIGAYLANGAISVYWTEGSSTFNIVGEQLALSTGTTMQATMDGTGDLAATLTVAHPLIAAPGGSGDLTPTVTVAHPLIAAVDGTGDLQASLTVARALQVALDGVGDLSATLTVAKALQATLDGQGDLSTILTVAHILQTTLDGAGDLQAALTVAHALQAIADGQGDLLGTLTAVSGLIATLDASGDLQAALTVIHTLASILDGSGDLQAALSVEKALSAILDGSGDLAAMLTVLGKLKTPRGTIGAGQEPAGTLGAGKAPGATLSGATTPSASISAGTAPSSTLSAGKAPAGTLEEE